MNRRFLPPDWLILLVIFIYSGLFFFSIRNPGNSLKNDSPGYLQLAENLRSHYVFSASTAPPLAPEVFRIPGYPVFLALTDAEPSGFRVAMGLQCLMGIMLLFLTWPWFYRLGGIPGAYFGTLFLCLDLATVLHQNLILTEPLMGFTLPIALGVSMSIFEKPTTKRAVLSGLLFGTAALIKPIALFPAIALVLCSFRSWKSACLLALVTFAFPLAWTTRNWALTGRPVYTVQGGYAMFLYPAANALAMDAGISRTEAVQRMEKSMMDEGFHQTMDPISQSIAYKQKALDIMKQHPVATLKIHLKGVATILGGTGLEMILDLLQISRPSEKDVSRPGAGTLALLKRYPVLIGVQLVYLVFLLGGYLLFMRGGWMLVQRGHWRFAVFLTMSILLILMASAHQGYYRFRLPLIPFLAFGIAASFIP